MGLYLEEFSVGDVHESPRRTVTEADVVMFAGLSGDYNSAHTDHVHAAATPFGRPIAHGALVLSIATGLSTRIGYLDGTALAMSSIDNWNFKAPVFFGDTVRLRTTVVEVRPSKSKPDRGVLIRKFEMINQDGQTVQEGFTSVMVKTKGR